MKIMNRIYDVLSGIENIENPKALQFVDERWIITFERHLCKCFAPCPYQTDGGIMFCFFCEHPDGIEINRNAFFDVRLHRKLCQIKIICHFKNDGCKWIGDLICYDHHILFCCMFSKAKCSECCEIVSLINMKEHNETDKCKNYKNRIESCPLKCGHESENWIMQSHVVEECPESRNTCLWMYECLCERSKEEQDGHSLKCVEKNFEIVSKKLFDLRNETFEFDFELLATKTLLRNFMFLQNMLKAMLELNVNRFTMYLEVRLFLFQTHKNVAIANVLKETKLTVGLTNLSSEADKHGDHKRLLSIAPKGTSRFISFEERKFIFLENILKNKKTGTCFHHNGTIHVTVNLQYPNKFEMTD